MRPCLAVIGSNRRRTGTGPFVSEFLRQHGCSVVSWDRNESARFLDPDSTIPEIDAVAICSPAETHLDYLAAALARGLHVFCEKPIVWPREDSRCAGPVLLNVLAEALDVARRNSLVVHENTQWVYTLEDFRRIAGAFAPNEIAQFRCELSPSGGTAAGMIMECSTHANSLLLELGCRGVEEPLVRFEAGGAGRPATLDIRFRSRRPSGAPVEVEYQFARQAGQPRHAAYEVNCRRVERRVNLDGYRLSLQYGGEEYPIGDPLRASVGDFLAKISAAGSDAGRDGADRILTNIGMSFGFLNACASLTERADA